MSLSKKDHFELKVARRLAEAKDVTVLELCDPNGRSLPSFSPGAHLEVQLNGSLVRHYSLLNDSRENNRYVIAVGLSAESSGGSSYIHSHVREGDIMTVSPPRNNFPLEASAERYCFIAGGIGITPIMSMVRWCINNGKEWRLFYTTRSRQRAAFYEELQSLRASPQQVNFHFNDEHSGNFLDLEDVASLIAPDEHVYCCGPDPLMQNVKRVMADHPDEQVHFEWFSAPEVPVQETSDDAQQDGFDVILRESGRTIHVQHEESILEALESQGVEVPCSCRAGICRTCETAVISGTPDHRDFILSEEEKASGETMLICVSRAKSASLEIDL
ncbi:PDR/VanB family oxidoreductase [Halomonas elongata]|uniref:PDR/VanB family oxidoreductase n=1 Tax=Halomonas elongata TaxID=2746 RepID=UPI00403371EF